MQCVRQIKQPPSKLNLVHVDPCSLRCRDPVYDPCPLLARPARFALVRLLLLLVLKSLAGLHMFLHLDDINKIEDVHVADDADVVLEQGESGEQRRCADKYFKV